MTIVILNSTVSSRKLAVPRRVISSLPSYSLSRLDQVSVRLFHHSIFHKKKVHFALQAPGCNGDHGLQQRCLALRWNAIGTDRFIPRAATTKVPPKCHQNEKASEQFLAFIFKPLISLKLLVALPGLEPGLFALRGRRVNQSHHNATARKKIPLRLNQYIKRPAALT